MMPAVGKSGPLHDFQNLRQLRGGLFISRMVASTISVRLCGGMLVAMPTAMPFEPLISRFGMRVGRTVGSEVELVKIGDEVHRVFIDVGQHLLGDARHAAFGVPIGRGGIAIHRTKISLPIHQRVAQTKKAAPCGPTSRTARVPVRMILLPATLPPLWRTSYTCGCAADPCLAWRRECGDARA